MKSPKFPLYNIKKKENVDEKNSHSITFNPWGFECF